MTILGKKKRMTDAGGTPLNDHETQKKKGGFVLATWRKNGKSGSLRKPRGERGRPTRDAGRKPARTEMISWEKGKKKARISGRGGESRLTDPSVEEFITN